MNKKLSIALLLGFLIPGLGHLYLGERMRGIIFFISIILLFGMGWILEGGILWEEMNILTVLAYIVNFFNGIAFVFLSFERLFNTGLSYYHEIGTTLMLISGSLNILVLFNVYDHYQEKAMKS